MAEFTAKPPKQYAQEKSGVETIRLCAAAVTGHRHAARVDDVRLDTTAAKPPRQPEPVASGLVGDNEALDLSPGCEAFLTPTNYQRKEMIRVGFELLQRLPFDAGKQSGDKPSRLAHFDDNDERVILIEGRCRTATRKLMQHGASPFSRRAPACHGPAHAP